MEMQYKITMLGGGGVGKSALTIMLVTDKFSDIYDPSVEDSYRKLTTVDGEGAQIDILDTAGQEEFVVMHDEWIRAGEGFLLVYSISSRTSFEVVKYFRDKVMRTKETVKPPMVLAGNKCDLPESERSVTKQEGEALARSWGIPFYETSAKDRINTDECFHQLVREIKRSRGSRTSKVKKDKGDKGCMIL
eukprot:TRINITY_DN2665_c0_g1_i1.p1 TRINITY_DN2665_c0_g1~~TRINITY_DN2665_c0_g1_i1.p1  ORF type:complete len:190 (-),score=34.59 TRINITY_DN2665_c0_g1_i1:28-597(-)